MDDLNLDSMLDALKPEQHITPDDIPHLNLYMDQVISLFEDHLAHTKRHLEDKLLTKTMINNYTKNKLLMPAVKKKYTPEHLLLLALIYELKQVTSLEDIRTLFSLIRDDVPDTTSEDSSRLHRLYTRYLDLQEDQKRCVRETLHTLDAAAHQKTAPSAEDIATDRALCCLLLFEQSLTYKRLAEGLLDDLSADLNQT